MVGYQDLLVWHQNIALSWQVMSELARRHPEGSIVQEWAHQGYDCLFFKEPEVANPVLTVRNGSIHVEGLGDQPGGGWWHAAMFGAGHVARMIESATDLPGLARTPRTTRKTLTYRILAATSAQSLANGVLIDPRPGYAIDDDGGRLMRSYFEQYADAKILLDETGFDENSTPTPGERFWFLIPHFELHRSSNGRTQESSSWERNEPVAAFHDSGLFWSPSQDRVDLMALYNSVGRSFEELMLDIVGRLPTLRVEDTDDDPA